jgi:serine/threonine-protein kinase
MNGTEKGAKNNYFRSLSRKRARVTHITPAGAFFRRIGNRLDKSMGNLIGIAAASAVVVLLAGITAFATVIMPDRGGVIRITVPDFTGEKYSPGVADEELFDVSLQYKFDGSSPAGTVIAQYPNAGANRIVKEGERRCALTLTLSRGTETVILPDCTGISANQAEMELRALGFNVVIEKKYNGTVRAGSVISTSPSAYSDVPSGNTVTIYVSLGQDLDSVTVPALTGLGETAAITKILSLGLLVGKTEYIKSTKPAGTVIAQSAPFGSTVREGTKIYLTVSLGGG